MQDEQIQDLSFTSTANKLISPSGTSTSWHQQIEALFTPHRLSI